jgi:DNA-binding transcriptional LysR family regulator
MDLRKIRYFVAVYEAGSITRAAEREHIAQPALTVHIQQLEEELSVRLFERSAQGANPTPAARHLYPLCVDILRQLRAVGDAMNQYTGAVAGTITAGIMPSICHGPLAPMLAQFTAEYPNVAVRVVEGLSGTLANWVLDGSVDFAVCSRPASTQELQLRLLKYDSLVLVSGPKSPLQPFAPCTLAQIPELKLVLPSAHHFLRHTLEHHIQQGDFRPVKTLEIDGQSATLQFVAHSDWCTILPTIALVNEFESGRFTINPVESPRLSTEIYELRSPRHDLTPAAERFIAMLETHLQQTPALPSHRS